VAPAACLTSSKGEVKILKSPPTSRGRSKCLALISISSAGCLQLYLRASVR